ncbi:hypothetical protein [Mesorhizobium sp. DCY119]|uniref:hypothetical protein n=1 Tax=Mesorhizobium sp. DCY119 TaxID=2108445 RepID=UPI001058D6D5|nr:hypothetical protein [Mesorhizobium sp. DCY119]
MKQETGETLRKQEETPPQQETSPPASGRVIQILPHRLQALPGNLILPPLSNASNPPQMKPNVLSYASLKNSWRGLMNGVATRPSKQSRISGVETPRIKSSKSTK